MGHLFVVQADLTRLVLDDVIVPCDGDLNVHRGFLDIIDDPMGESTFPSPAHRRVMLGNGAAVPGPWKATRKPDRAQPWLLDTTPRQGDLRADLDSLITRITGAIGRIAADHKPGTGARRPRIGLILMGIHAGGYRERYDEVVLRTVEALRSAAAAPAGPDIVLALRTRSDYAAVQHLRRTHGEALLGPGDPGSSTPGGKARQLAEMAAHGRLVLFIGAGASKGAGLPDWWGLLKELADKVQPPLNMDEFAGLDARDAALLVGLTHPDEQEMRARIAQSLSSDRYSLTHALLASLQVDQAITTNYDTLYESAFSDSNPPQDKKLVVLPREPYVAGRPWLMKMHGDAERPNSIVLSRDDYIDFDARSVPMASALQSAMLTSHLLFVGYSVKDENVVRLARQVVRFREHHVGRDQHEAQGAVGTVLVPRIDRTKQALWRHVLDFVEFGAVIEGSEAGSEPRDARLLEFLDVLGALACREASYFLIDRYRGLLSEGDQHLIEPLRSLAEAIEGVGASSVAAPLIRDLLESLGSGEDGGG